MEHAIKPGDKITRTSDESFVFVTDVDKKFIYGLQFELHDDKWVKIDSEPKKFLPGGWYSFKDESELRKIKKILKAKEPALYSAQAVNIVRREMGLREIDSNCYSPLKYRK